MPCPCNCTVSPVPNAFPLSAVHRLRQEVELQARLVHKHVLKMFGAFVVGAVNLSWWHTGMPRESGWNAFGWAGSK
mgnify:CR=1 FL=1